MVEEGQVDRTVISKASVCDHCHVTRPFDRLVRRQKDWSKGPAGVDMYTAVALLAVVADQSIFVCVCFYTDEPWQGQWFSCHLGYYDVIGCLWQVMGVRVTESRVRPCLCVHCFVEKDTRVLPPKHHFAELFAPALHISTTCCDLTQPTGIWVL